MEAQVARDALLESAFQDAANHQQAGSQQGRAAALCTVVQLQILQGRVVEALSIAGEALALLRELQDATGKVMWLHAVAGGVDLVRGQPQEALQAASRAALHFRSLGEREGEAYSQLATASVHTTSGEAGKAVASSSLALSLFQRASLKDGECIALQIASKAHLLAGDAKAAVRAAEKARMLAQGALKDQPGLEPAAWLVLAEAYLSKALNLGDEDQYKKAKQAASRAVEGFVRMNDSESQQAALFALQRAQLGLQQHQEASFNHETHEEFVEDIGPSVHATLFDKARSCTLDSRQGLLYQVNGGRML